MSLFRFRIEGVAGEIGVEETVEGCFFDCRAFEEKTKGTGLRPQHEKSVALISALCANLGVMYESP